jgi:hypothetical protein
MDERMSAVITANKARQARAKELNARSGEKTFPVLSREELATWLQEKLDGAISVATVKDLEQLRLPPLGQELVDLVVTENPDSIKVLGRDCAVNYVDYREARKYPQVKIDFREEQANDWQNLPDVINLPSGREVAFYSAIDGYGYYIDCRSSEFKAKVRDGLNESQWSNWPETARPAIVLPDPADENSVVADVITTCYGKCVVTATDLVAFGTVALNPYRNYESDSWFKVLWTRNRTEAEQAHDAVVAKIVTIKEEVKRRREEEERRAREESMLATLRSQAELAKVRVGGYYESLCHKSDIDPVLRDRLYERRYDYRAPSTADGLRRWILETDALCEEAKTVTAEIEARNARREAHLEATRNLYSQASLLVNEDGTISVLRGKTSKIGSFEVDNSVGEWFTSEVSTDNEGRYCSWQPVRTGRLVRCREFSGAGNQKGEAEFIVQDGQLTPGVWSVAEDDNGRFFYPVIYYKNGREIVPEKFEVVREVRECPRVHGPVVKGPPAPAGSLDMTKLFGGATMPREKPVRRR